MADIFISYAKKDRSRVEPLAKALEDRGWTVFWDRTIPVRKSWRRVIQSELETAKCVVIIWTENSIKSRWVLAEVNEGYEKDILTQVLFDNVMDFSVSEGLISEFDIEIGNPPIAIFPDFLH